MPTRRRPLNAQLTRLWLTPPQFKLVFEPHILSGDLTVKEVGGIQFLDDDEIDKVLADSATDVDPEQVRWPR